MRRRADAFLVASGAFMFFVRRELADLALQARLPAIAALKEFPETGLRYAGMVESGDRESSRHIDEIVYGQKD